jgi:hypothetical protein
LVPYAFRSSERSNLFRYDLVTIFVLLKHPNYDV